MTDSARLMMVIPADSIKPNDAVLIQMPWDFNGPAPLRVADVDVGPTQVQITTVVAGPFTVSKGVSLAVLREVSA